MKSYYNEFSKFPAEWIRNLIKAGIVPGGCVDERSLAVTSLLYDAYKVVKL